MRASTFSIVPLLALASAQTTGQLGDAPKVNDNPAGASYVATLPEKSSTTLRGSVTVVSGAGGKGVDFAVSFSGIPAEGGPFLYHLHDQPVPADGNCTSTLAHLDPFIRGEATPCDATHPETCQVGDLSGKYGKPPNGESAYSASYNDPYAALVPGIGAFFGNRSIVFHFANKTRISCANFVQLSAGSAGNSSSSGSSSAYSSVASSAGAASASATNSFAGQVTSTATSTLSQFSMTPFGTPTPSASRPPVVLQSTAAAPMERLVNGAALLGGVAAAALMM